jgi:excisionase family DNA binding protein
MTTVRGTGEGIGKEQADAALLDVRQVSALLGVSPRHVARLAETGKMPAPLRLGACVRWSRAALSAWISRGCPPVRAAKGAAR